MDRAHMSIDHGDGLLLTTQCSVGRSPGAVVAAETALHITAVEVAKSPASTTIDHELLAQLQATESQPIAAAPADGSTVEDRPR